MATRAKVIEFYNHGLSIRAACLQGYPDARGCGLKPEYDLALRPVGRAIGWTAILLEGLPLRFKPRPDAMIDGESWTGKFDFPYYLFHQKKK